MKTGNQAGSLLFSNAETQALLSSTFESCFQCEQTKTSDDGLLDKQREMKDCIVRFGCLDL